MATPRRSQRNKKRTAEPAEPEPASSDTQEIEESTQEQHSTKGRARQRRRLNPRGDADEDQSTTKHAKMSQRKENDAALNLLSLTGSKKKNTGAKRKRTEANEEDEEEPSEELSRRKKRKAGDEEEREREEEEEPEEQDHRQEDEEEPSEELSRKRSRKKRKAGDEEEREMEEDEEEAEEEEEEQLGPEKKKTKKKKKKKKDQTVRETRVRLKLPEESLILVATHKALKYSWKRTWKNPTVKSFLKRGMTQRYLRDHVKGKLKQERRKKNKRTGESQTAGTAQEQREDAILERAQAGVIKNAEVRSDAETQNELLKKSVEQGALYVELMMLKSEETKRLREEVKGLKEWFTKELEEMRDLVRGGPAQK